MGGGSEGGRSISASYVSNDHRYQRENQDEMQRIRLAWDGFAQESSKRLQQELVQ